MQQEEIKCRWISFSVKLLLALYYTDITWIYTIYIFAHPSRRLHIFKEKQEMSSNLLSAHLCSWKRPNISSSNPNMESTVFTVCEDTFLCLICNIQFTFRLWCNWIWSGLNSLFPCNKQLTVWDGSRKSKSTEPQIIDWILHMLLILCSGVGTSIHTKSVEPLNH